MFYIIIHDEHTAQYKKKGVVEASTRKSARAQFAVLNFAPLPLLISGIKRCLDVN